MSIFFYDCRASRATLTGSFMVRMSIGYLSFSSAEQIVQILVVDLINDTPECETSYQRKNEHLPIGEFLQLPYPRLEEKESRVKVIDKC